MRSYILEVCADCVESAVAAADSGADRLELCANLIIGGTTPSLELFREVKKRTKINIGVLIRPRFGDFHYTPCEHEIMCREIETFVKEGADRIVAGSLNTDGTLCVPQMKEIAEAAGNCPVTLHRAFDVCKNPLAVLEQAADLHIDTILTSGQAENCMEGRTMLKTLLEKAPEGMNILIGGGVTPEAIRRILSEMPARNFHMSGKKIIESEMTWRNPRVSMGLPGVSEYERYGVDAGMIRQAKEILETYF